MPTAQRFNKLERICFNVESGDQHDSASGIPSASEVALALERYLRGLEVQPRVIGRCIWCLGKPKVVGKDPPSTWKVGCYLIGCVRFPPRWHW